MSKSMVGAAGGGKVIVEGLDPETLLTGNVVKVLQGAKEIASIEGELDVLAVIGAGSYGNTTFGGGYFWSGEKNNITGANGSFEGTPKLAYGGVYGPAACTVCGVPIVSTYQEVKEFVNKSVTYKCTGTSSHGAGYAFAVVLGTK